MARKPKVEMFPDEDKGWGGYKEAVQCIHCRRWLVVDFEQVYFASNGNRVHVLIFKELGWDGYHWYISNRTHNPNICGHQRQRAAWAKEEGFKSYKAFRRHLDQLSKENGWIPPE